MIKRLLIDLQFNERKLTDALVYRVSAFRKEFAKLLKDVQTDYERLTQGGDEGGEGGDAPPPPQFYTIYRTCIG